MFRRRPQAPQPLDEVLTAALRRAPEERLFLLEQLLGSLDRERRLRALTNGLYHCLEAEQLALWEELSHWVGAATSAGPDDALAAAADRADDDRLALVEGLLSSLEPEHRRRALANAAFRSPESDVRRLWEQLTHWVGAAVPARERYGEAAPQARMPTAERDRLLLQVLPESLQDPASVFYARQRFLYFRRRFAALAADFEARLADGLTLLEIGPGEHVGVAALFAARGAQVTMIDHLELLRPGDTRYYRDLLAVMDEGGPYDWASVFRFEGERVVFADRLRYRAPVDDGAVPLPASSCDAAFSAGTLEHVRDLPALCRELARALRPGAPMVHLLDLSDHRAAATDGPLSHLCLGPEDWAAVDSDAGYYQSRRLAEEYRVAFAAAGFTDVTLEVLGRASLGDALRARLDVPFRDLAAEALTPIDVLITARAP